MWPGFDVSIGNDVPSIASIETLLPSILTIRLKRIGGEGVVVVWLRNCTFGFLPL